MTEQQQFNQMDLGSRVAFQTSDQSALELFSGLGFDCDGSALQGARGEYVMRRSLFALVPPDTLPIPQFKVRTLS